MDATCLWRGAGRRAFIGSLLWLGCMSSANAGLLINEVDYDQPGSDHAEFVELFNATSSPLGLGDFVLQLINGTTGSPYRSFSLPTVELPSLGYFVVCGDPAQVPNCDWDVSPDANLIQNGAPDAIALLSGDRLRDVLSYEGEVAAFSEGASPAEQDNSSTPFVSLARLPDGLDSDHNAADFVLACSTPGYANVAAGSTCAAPHAVVEAATVREPPAVSLLALGVLALWARARRRRGSDDGLSARPTAPRPCR